jgi:hypothetical protein
MSWQLDPLLIADVAYRALRRYWDISDKDWEARRRDDSGDRGPWEDQPWLAREAAALPGQTFERHRPDGSKTLYRRTVDGWRVEPDDLDDPKRGTLQQNAANWRAQAGRWRRRLAYARAEGDEEAVARAQDEADTAERIADVKEKYPHVKVLPDNEWTFDPETKTLDDGGLLEHPPTSPEGYREHAEWKRAHAEIKELNDPLGAARDRVEADDLDAKADDKEAEAGLYDAEIDFEWAAMNADAAPPPPPPTPPPASPLSGGTMSDSIGDAAAGIRGANDTAGEANGVLQQASALVEQARGQLLAAVAGSPQADASEAVGMFGRAMEAIADAQKAVLGAITSAEGVAGRL